MIISCISLIIIVLGIVVIKNKSLNTKSNIIIMTIVLSFNILALILAVFLKEDLLTIMSNIFCIMVLFFGIIDNIKRLTKTKYTKKDNIVPDVEDDQIKE